MLIGEDVGFIAAHALKGEAVAPAAVPTAVVQLTAWAWNGDERSLKKKDAAALLEEMEHIYNSKVSNLPTELLMSRLLSCCEYRHPLRCLKLRLIRNLNSHEFQTNVEIRRRFHAGQVPG